MRKDEGLDKLDVHVNKDLSSVVDAIIYYWNLSKPPKTSYLNNALKQAAIKKFHLHYTSTKSLEEADLGKYRLHIDTIGMILEEMRSETYKFLKNKGLKEITLFRGMKSPVKMTEHDVDVTKLAALSS